VCVDPFIALCGFPEIGRVKHAPIGHQQVVLDCRTTGHRPRYRAEGREDRDQLGRRALLSLLPLKLVQRVRRGG
jgi:hypothetical protein